MNKIVYWLKNNEKPTLCLLVVLTLILRSIYVVFKYKNFGTSEWGDGYYYFSLGEKIAAGNWASQSGGASNMIVAPVVPILVAIFVKFFSNPIVPFLIYNMIATSLVVPVLYYLGKEVFNKRIGWLIAIWGVLNIEYFRYNADILKESTIYLFLPLTLFFLIKSIKYERPFRYLFYSAVSFTLLIHTDERFFAYFPILPLLPVTFWITRHIKFKNAIRSIAIWVGVVFLLMLPWGIHNYKVYNQVVIVSPRTTSFTSKLWGKDISGMNSFRSIIKVNTLIADNDRNQAPKVEGLKLYMKSFINFWQPAYFKEQFVQYSWYENPVFQKWSLQHNLLSIIFYGIFLPFYILGIIFLIIQVNPIGLFLGLIPIIHSLIHTYMVMPDERYRSTMVFIIAMIGFWVATKLHENVKNKMSKKPDIITSIE